MSLSLCVLAAFSPTVPSLSILRFFFFFFPVINILSLSLYITLGINHQLPWRWSHPSRCVCVRLTPLVGACVLACSLADCTCFSTSQSGEASAGDAALPRCPPYIQSGFDSCLVEMLSPATLGFLPALCRIMTRFKGGEKKKTHAQLSGLFCFSPVKGALCVKAIYRCISKMLAGLE